MDSESNTPTEPVGRLRAWEQRGTRRLLGAIFSNEPIDCICGCDHFNDLDDDDEDDDLCPCGCGHSENRPCDCDL